MKRMVTVCVLALFVFGGTALAQDPENPFANNIGIYLNPAGTGSCGAIDADIPFTVYVILTTLTYPEVWGWEAKFITENILNLGLDFYGNGINAGTREGEFLVGLSEPLMATNNSLVIAEIDLVINGFLNDVSQPSNVFIEGVYFSLLDNGQPAYLEAVGSTGVSLYQAIGGMGTAQLSMNCDCAPVGVESSSWGDLKSLYR